MPAIEAFSELTDQDFKRIIVRALRLLTVIALLAMALLEWKLGWRSASLLGVGAAISGSGIWEWMRLMTAVMEGMDAGAKARPMGAILTSFFLRLGLTVVVLYVSLSYLNGSVYALAAGLGLGVVSLTVEGFRQVRAWTG